MRTFEDRILILGRINPRLWTGFSDSMGKIKVSGKGIFSLTFYRATLTEGRSDILRIREAVMEKTFYKLTRNYRKFRTVSRAFGIIRDYIPYNFPIEGLLDTTYSFLKEVEDSRDEHLTALYMLWLYRLLEHSGELEHILTCRKCGSSEIKFYLEGTGFLCENCVPENARAPNNSTILLLKHLGRFDYKSVKSIGEKAEKIIPILEDSLKWLSS